MAEKSGKAAIKFAENRMAGVQDQGNLDGKGKRLNNRALEFEIGQQPSLSERKFAIRLMYKTDGTITERKASLTCLASVFEYKEKSAPRGT